MRICEYVEKRKEILGEVKWMKENENRKLRLNKMGFRVYMRLPFEICFVGWLLKY